jgi:alpha-ribazole phosphatase/probable phosphoglycerate mutase
MIPPRADGATRFVVVRHGEPDEAMRGRCYGRLDVGLSSRGRAQADGLHRRLDAVELDAIYSSPSVRTVETARPLSAARALPLIADVRLRELDFGVAEGLAWDELRAREPALYDAWMASPTEVTFPGGEAFSSLRARVLDCARELQTRHAEQTVALVIHGGPARVLLADALGLPAPNLFRIDQSYGGVSVIDRIDGAPVVRIINMVPGA